MTSFATPDQLSIYLGLGPLPRGSAGTDQAQLEQWTLLLELVSADVEVAAGRTIEASTGTIKLAGTWSRDLTVPKQPLTAVTSVSLNGTAVTDYEWNERQLLRRSAVFGDYDDDGAGWNWGGPDSTVELTCSWGYTTVPGWATSITLRACSRVLGNPGQVTQETLGVYSATYGDRTADGSHITEAERRYLRRAAGVSNAGTFTQRAFG